MPTVYGRDSVRTDIEEGMALFSKFGKLWQEECAVRLSIKKPFLVHNDLVTQVFWRRSEAFPQKDDNIW